jgi:hypothetical protein
MSAKYVYFICKEGYSNHRHGANAAPGGTDGIQVRQRDFAAQLWLPDENSHADQARLG